MRRYIALRDRRLKAVKTLDYCRLLLSLYMPTITFTRVLSPCLIEPYSPAPMFVLCTCCIVFVVVRFSISRQTRPSTTALCPQSSNSHAATNPWQLFPYARVPLDWFHMPLPVLAVSLSFSLCLWTTMCCVRYRSSAAPQLQRALYLRIYLQRGVPTRALCHTRECWVLPRRHTTCLSTTTSLVHPLGTARKIHRLWWDVKSRRACSGDRWGPRCSIRGEKGDAQELTPPASSMPEIKSAAALFPCLG